MSGPRGAPIDVAVPRLVLAAGDPGVRPLALSVRQCGTFGLSDAASLVIA